MKIITGGTAIGLLTRIQHGRLSFRHFDELQILLFELTKAVDVEGIQNLTANYTPDDFPLDRVAGPAILLAATRGSLPMVEVLTDWYARQSTRGPRYFVFHDETKAFYSAISLVPGKAVLFVL